MDEAKTATTAKNQKEDILSYSNSLEEKYEETDVFAWANNLVQYVDDLKIEVDVFKGVYEGVVFAEIEFKSEEQATQIELPKWFDKEMSQIITNSKMATQNMKSFIEFEK